MDRLKILVIDDDAGDRMILRRLLRRSGLDAKLTEAENARGAPEKLDGLRVAHQQEHGIDDDGHHNQDGNGH